MTFPDLCNYLGSSKKTIYRYIKAGLPYMQPNGSGKKFFDKAKVDRWLLKWEYPNYRLTKRRRT